MIMNMEFSTLAYSEAKNTVSVLCRSMMARLTTAVLQHIKDGGSCGRHQRQSTAALKSRAHCRKMERFVQRLDPSARHGGGSRWSGGRASGRSRTRTPGRCRQCRRSTRGGTTSTWGPTQTPRTRCASMPHGASSSELGHPCPCAKGGSRHQRRAAARHRAASAWWDCEAQQVSPPARPAARLSRQGATRRWQRWQQLRRIRAADGHQLQGEASAVRAHEAAPPHGSAAEAPSARAEACHHRARPRRGLRRGELCTWDQYRDQNYPQIPSPGCLCPPLWYLEFHPRKEQLLGSHRAHSLRRWEPWRPFGPSRA